MDFELNSKTALVTGSSKGIGYGIALSLAKEGASVWIHGRSQASVSLALEKLKIECPQGQFQGVIGDIGTEEGLQTLIKTVSHLDILVNNAGYFEPEKFTDISRESWLKMFEVNVLSGATLTQHYLPLLLKANQGRVIFISSESAVNIPEEMIHYGMSKTAQLAVSRGAAELCKGSRVTVNSVLVGPTLSDGVGDFIQAINLTEAEFFQQARPTSLVQRFGSVSEIADFVCFIASERSSMINGAALRAEGGVIKSAF